MTTAYDLRRRRFSFLQSFLSVVYITGTVWTYYISGSPFFSYEGSNYRTFSVNIYGIVGS